ncbi:MAG: glycosyltransferase [Woeseiaceae bacterium]|nr:glycosyltransferase [Woeseiaceae bacterium]
MKIMHVETGRHFYGGAQQVVWLVRGLDARGLSNLLVCPPQSAIDSVARDAGLNVHNLACGGDLDLVFAWRLARLASREKVDLVHCHSRRGADFLGGQALGMSGIPAVLSRRVDSVEPGALARWRFRPFRKIIAISETIRSVLVAMGVDRERVMVIRSAVDLDAVKRHPDCAVFRREFDLDERDFVIAVVAQLIPRKGHKYLFDVVPKLLDSYPQLRVILFGSGPDEAHLQALADKLRIAHAIQFAGFRDDLDDFLGCIDLLVHPATREGLGVAMLKAAAAGVPVLAFDTAGSREAVLHGKTGVLVPVDNLDMLHKAITLLIDESDMRLELGQTGRQRMKDEFSLDTMLDKHIELYRSVVNDSR